jgi:hypothetical protein
MGLARLFNSCELLFTGELPVTLTKPDRSVILLQTPISIFVGSFYRSLIARLNRQGGPSYLNKTFVTLAQLTVLKHT